MLIFYNNFWSRYFSKHFWKPWFWSLLRPYTFSIEKITKPLQILYQIRKLITKFCIICNDPAADRTFFFYIFHFIKDGQDHRCFLFETLGTSKYLLIGSNNKLRNYKFEFSWLTILLTCCLFGFLFSEQLNVKFRSTYSGFVLSELVVG